MNRFFLPPESIQADLVTFPGDISHQIARVLRLKSGVLVAVLDNQGSEYQVELTAVEPKFVTGVVRRCAQAGGEPPVRVTLYLCLTQREKLEWVLQKCTETGVTNFVMVVSSRSLVQDTASAAVKFERWQRIVREAAEQCGRGRLPGLGPIMHMEEALKHGINNHQRSLLAWEGEKSQGLSAALADLNGGERLALLIGPEGGLSGEEVQMAQDIGWQIVSLGKRILRMETAAVVASARIIAACEDPPISRAD